MKNYIWKGPEREIPGYGLVHDGSSIPNMPEEMLESFISQGYVVNKSESQAKNKKED